MNGESWIKKLGSLLLCLVCLQLQTQSQNSYEQGMSLLEEGEALDFYFKYDEALPLYEQAADCFAELDSHRLESYALSWVGNMQIELGAYQKAQAPFEQAYALAQAADATAEALHAREGLAKLLYFNGEDSSAISVFREVIADKAASLGDKHIELAIPYNFVGSIYGNRGNYELATQYFSKGLAIRIHNLGADSKMLGSSYYNIGASYRIQGNYEQALEYFLKSYHLVRKHHGEDNLHLASIMHGIGTAYLGMTIMNRQIPIYTALTK
ncbi:MAG: tetratricopeptide repeat protein [Bacteroidota bacterium]